MDKSKHNNKHAQIRACLCCIWAKCGIEKFIDGHRVAAQPYLISKEITLYFFLISILKYVLDKILYVKILLLTDKGWSNILTIYSLYINNIHRYELTLISYTLNTDN